MEPINNESRPGKELAFKLGLAGGGIGLLSGLVQLIGGENISTITGHKDDTFILGLLTIIISGLAIYCVFRSSRETKMDINRRIGWFLGISIPAILCFFTVGYLWILSSVLLLVSTGIFINDMIKEFKESGESIISSLPHWKRTVALVGVLLIMIPLVFGSFTENTELASFQDEEGSYYIKPMATVERAGQNSTSSTVTGVLLVHLILLIGGIVALISGQLGARSITIFGGVVIMVTLLFFFFFIPNILFIQGAQMTQFDKDHFSSISGGWYIAVFGAAVLIASQLIGPNKEDSSVNGK